MVFKIVISPEHALLSLDGEQPVIVIYIAIILINKFNVQSLTLISKVISHLCVSSKKDLYCYTEGQGSNVLMQVQVPVVSTTQCRRAYGQSTVAINDQTVCAGYPQGGRDSCQVSMNFHISLIISNDIDVKMIYFIIRASVAHG